MRPLLLAIFAASTSACALLAPARGPLEVAKLEAGHQCALVLLPGLGDTPAHFDRHGFLDEVKGADAPCDVVVVDAHFGYYREAVLPQRLADEVLSPLRERYQQVWLVGVSMGGYGALLVTEARPELVDGLVLISPFLGVPSRVRPLVERVEAAGGLLQYRGEFAGRTRPRKHFLEVEPVWSWLSTRDEAGPRLVLAWGAADGFARLHRAAATALPTEDVLALEGGHEWETFAALWRRVVASAPWRG